MLLLINDIDNNIEKYLLSSDKFYKRVCKVDLNKLNINESLAYQKTGILDGRNFGSFSIQDIVISKGIGEFMNYKKLKSEIDNDPDAIGYVNMTNAEVADAMNYNDGSRTTIVPVYSATLLAWSGLNSRYFNIKTGAEQTASPALASICYVALGLIQRSDTSLDLNLIDRQQMLGTLVAAGVLAQSDSDDLYSLATKQVSRAQQIGLIDINTDNEVLEADVAFVRNI